MIDRVWMHIGAEKTGTTSLQYWLMENRDLLAQQRVLFPKSLGNFNHISLAAYGMDDSKGIEELRITCGANKYDSLDEFRSTIRAKIKREVQSSDARHVILSNEHCSSRLRSEDEVVRLRNLLFEFGADVRIVLYIREPVSFYASWYSTLVASGGTVDFPDELNKEFLKAANWPVMVRLWSDVFGSQNVIVRRFGKEHLVDGDLVSDFCSVIGLNPGDFSRTPQKNESLGLKALLFLRQMNATLPRLKDGQFNPERGNIAEVLRTYPEREKFTVPPDIADAINTFYEDDYERLKKLHFPEEDGPLFAKKSTTQCPDLSLSEDDYIDIAQHIWVNR